MFVDGVVFVDAVVFVDIRRLFLESDDDDVTLTLSYVVFVLITLEYSLLPNISVDRALATLVSTPVRSI